MSYDHLALRRTLLLQLEAAAPASLPRSTLLTGLTVAGFNLDPQTLAAELDYLAQKSFIVIVRSALYAAEPRAKLSAEGRDYLESGDL